MVILITRVLKSYIFYILLFLSIFQNEYNATDGLKTSILLLIFKICLQKSDVRQRPNNVNDVASYS